MSQASDTIAALLAARGARAGELPPAARKVIAYIERNPGLAVTSSAADLARATALSDATVIRAVQALGFEGMGDLRRELAAALAGETPAARMQRTLTDTGADVARAIGLALDEQLEAVTALRSDLARERLSEAVGALGQADRIVVFGVGPTGALARYAVAMLTRAGRQARALDATGTALADQLLDLRAGDALLLLAYGRAYREVTATLAEARRLLLPIVLVTDSLEPRLAKLANIVVPARRGRANRVALHGATLVALEALILGLAATDQPLAMRALGRLDALREAVAGTTRTDEGI